VLVRVGYGKVNGQKPQSISHITAVPAAPLATPRALLITGQRLLEGFFTAS
jgi:hypothetical protein